MARKMLTSHEVKSEELEEWTELAEMYGELGEEAFNYQDAVTQKVASMISQKILPSIEAPQGASLDLILSVSLYVALQILKDLAQFDIKVNNFKLDPNVCVGCGGDANGS